LGEGVATVSGMLIFPKSASLELIRHDTKNGRKVPQSATIQRCGKIARGLMIR
jgi:hypothetical protein